jgi:hypothetical protein
MEKDTLPVAIYDTEKKQCVMLFSTINKADRYVFDKKTYGSHQTRYLVMNKGKTAKNQFNRTLAFRYANAKQREMLGAEVMMILDNAFTRDAAKIETFMKTVKLSRSAKLC